MGVEGSKGYWCQTYRQNVWLDFSKGCVYLHESLQEQMLTSSTDIILKVAGILTVKGGTGAIIEYQ